MNKRINTLLHPLVLSVPFAVILIVLLPDYFDRYKIQVDDKFNTSNATTRLNYHDLDHDGYSESIIRNNNIDGSGNFVVFTHAGGVINQWNFKNAWVPNSELIVGDYNNNGIDEIYGFTFSGDSVFLEGIEVKDLPDTICNRLFIDRIADHGDQNDFGISGAQVINVDDDDQKEILFSIHTGFAQQPRNTYLYDPLEKELLKSPLSGASTHGYSVIDIDKDGLMEIVNTSSNAGNNIHIDVPFNDSSAWLMVFDHRLQFKWEPIQFGGLWTNIRVIPYFDNLIVGVVNGGKEGGIPRVIKYDKYGNMLSEIWLYKEEDKIVANFFVLNEKPDHIYLAGGEDGVYEFDQELNIINEFQVNGKSSYMYSKDLNLDGTNELLTSTKDGSKTIILNNDFTDPVYLDIEGLSLKDINMRFNGIDPPQFTIRSVAMGKYYLLSYYKNPMYVFQYPIWLGIYLFIAGFVFMVQRLQDIRNASKRAVELELAKLQLINVKNQFDPHFTFNALNTIGSVIYKEDKEVAYDYIVKFSKLIRSILDGSDKLTIKLSHELEFIRNYLDLQQFRFKGQFEYIIKVSPDVNVEHVDVPKMIIQNYVENAVKHGLKPIKTGGHLLIEIIKTGGRLGVNIEDNGIGRKAASHYSGGSTGKGMSLNNRFYELYERLYNKKIKIKIIDLEDSEGSPKGTRVELVIPYL